MVSSTWEWPRTGRLFLGMFSPMVGQLETLEATQITVSKLTHKATVILGAKTSNTMDNTKAEIQNTEGISHVQSRTVLHWKSPKATWSCRTTQHLKRERVASGTTLQRWYADLRDKR